MKGPEEAKLIQRRIELEDSEGVLESFQALDSEDNLLAFVNNILDTHRLGTTDLFLFVGPSGFGKSTARRNTEKVIADRFPYADIVNSATIEAAMGKDGLIGMRTICDLYERANIIGDSKTGKQANFSPHAQEVKQKIVSGAWWIVDSATKLLEQNLGSLTNQVPKPDFISTELSMIGEEDGILLAKHAAKKTGPFQNARDLRVHIVQMFATAGQIDYKSTEMGRAPGESGAPGPVRRFWTKQFERKITEFEQRLIDQGRLEPKPAIVADQNPQLQIKEREERRVKVARLMFQDTFQSIGAESAIAVRTTDKPLPEQEPIEEAIKNAGNQAMVKMLYVMGRDLVSYFHSPTPPRSSISGWTKRIVPAFQIEDGFFSITTAEAARAGPRSMDTVATHISFSLKTQGEGRKRWAITDSVNISSFQDIKRLYAAIRVRWDELPEEAKISEYKKVQQEPENEIRTDIVALPEEIEELIVFEKPETEEE